MRVKQIVMLLILTGFVSGCAGSASVMNNLTVGMTKAQVIDALGTPDYTSGKKDTEVLCYRLTSDGLFRDSYFVVIKSGRLDRFGRQGDFGIYY